MAGVRNETEFLCGGTLIHKSFVLTAAHCIEGHGRLFVRLGAYNLSLPTVEYSVSNTKIHRGYSRKTLEHDIGLLKLPLDVLYSEQIYPICIDLNPTTQTEVGDATTFDAYGWGKTQTATMSDILQRVTLDRYHRSMCYIFVGNHRLTSNQICAGSLNGDTCYGDSGGPLIKELNYNGIRRLTQFGIVSYGSRSCNGLGIYTDVTRYANWIEVNIKDLFFQNSWPPSSFAVGIANPASISPPSETVAFGVESFDRARLLVEPCGTAVSPRIKGGNDAEQEAAAWMAAVYNGTQLICGSTVIHRRYVLTSAYCISHDAFSDLHVKLGAYDRRHPTMEFNVTKKIVHDNFNASGNDIGLLQLSDNIPFSRRVYPICIILSPEFKGKAENAYTFDAYGWGEKNDGFASYRLRKVTLDRYDRSVCRNITGFPLISSQICAGDSVGNTCHGDAGGPLTKSVLVNGLQRQTQFGVIGYNSNNCLRKGVYTDVTSFVDWIVQNVRGFTDA